MKVGVVVVVIGGVVSMMVGVPVIVTGGVVISGSGFAVLLIVSTPSQVLH